MTERKRDYAYEALAEVTGAHLHANRGELNASLKSIAEQTPAITDNYLLADEIHRRAKLYREVMGPEVLITPPALAKHWTRLPEVAHQRKQPEQKGENRSVSSACKTCGADRFVVVATRKLTRTQWMEQHGVQLADDEIDEYAPCPDCNPQEIVQHRHDGTTVRTPDPARTREMMSQ